MSTTADLLGHVLLPIANEADAKASARALEPYRPKRVTVLYIVEKADGAPDKTPVEQSEQIAAESFKAAQTILQDVAVEIRYARDIPETIFETAAEIDASAIAYRSRGGNRLLQFLSGDLSLKLVTQADRPVIALPRDDTDD